MTTANKKDDVDVRLVDQEQINEFGRLNNRLMELRAEIKQSDIDNEKLDDATAELMMAASGSDGRVMLLIGEAFIESSEEEATEYCEKKQNALQARIISLKTEETDIVSRQDKLKKELYGRFGDSINLES